VSHRLNEVFWEVIFLFGKLEMERAIDQISYSQGKCSLKSLSQPLVVINVFDTDFESCSSPQSCPVLLQQQVARTVSPIDDTAVVTIRAMGQVEIRYGGGAMKRKVLSCEDAMNRRLRFWGWKCAAVPHARLAVARVLW